MKRLVSSLLFFCLVSATALASYTLTNSPLHSSYTSAQGYKFTCVDRGGSAWVLKKDNNGLLAAHPRTGTLASYVPMASGKNASGSAVTLNNAVGLAVDTGAILMVAVNNGTSGVICRFQTWNGVAQNGWNTSYGPGGIAADGINRVYVSEKSVTGNRAVIHVYNGSGTELTGSPVQITGTGTNTLTGLAVTQDGTALFVGSESEGKILKLSLQTTGSSVSLTSSQDIVSAAGITGLATDDLNMLYGTATSPASIRKWNSDGTLIETFPITGITAPLSVSPYANGMVVTVADGAASGKVFGFNQTAGYSVPVLGYHNVTSSWTADFGMMVSPDNFRDQVQLLKRHGYYCLNPDEFYDYWLRGTNYGSKMVSFTFDDNYEGEVLYGGAVLQEAGWTGMIFAHTNYVGTNPSVGYRGSWAQLNTSFNNSVMWTGSHTKLHLNITSLTTGQVMDELIGSRQAILSNMPNNPAYYMAYPYGAGTMTSDGGLIPAIGARAGYRLCFNYDNSLATRLQPSKNISRLVMPGSLTLNQFKTLIGFTDSRFANDPYIVNNDGNADGSFTSTGTWTNTTKSPINHYGCYGSNYLTATGGTSATATFTPNVQTAGEYKVYGWWMADSSYAANVPVTINAATVSTVTVNQQISGSQWTYLGTAHFNAGSGSVVFSAASASGKVVADAIKLEPASTDVTDFTRYE